MKMRHAIQAVQYFGIGNISLGLWHRFTRISGLLKRKFPVCRWKDLFLEDYVQRQFYGCDLTQLLKSSKFLPVQNLNRTVLSHSCLQKFQVCEISEKLKSNQIQFFSHKWAKYGPKIDWHINPFNKARWPSDTHWCDINLFDADKGDIKFAWEASRFSWAWHLVRAYKWTGNEEYAELFWRLFESWLEDNQPNLGIHWISGQECALRIMAWTFALYGFLDSSATTDARVEKMLLGLYFHAQRIEGFISHAIRQKTNHALTEAAGLYTVGTVFSFLKNANRWRNMGQKIIEREGIRQIYRDGGYVQQSANYHRVMLQTLLWYFVLARLNEHRISDILQQRFARAVDFIYEMCDVINGRTPNYGPNDGALVLPLNGCDYSDFRPVIQAGAYLTKGCRIFPHGPWDEDMIWLFGPGALDSKISPPKQKSRCFSESGYFTLRDDDSWAMLRCHTYKDRVGHVDLLHLDLWSQGENLLRDCGSYKYFAPEDPELEYYFKSIFAHNTIILNNASPLRLASRFIWLPWPKAQVLCFKDEEDRILFSGRHFAYYRNPGKPVHQRECEFDKRNDIWKIKDKIFGKKIHQVELRWHMPLRSKLLKCDKNNVEVNLNEIWHLRVFCPKEFICKILESKCMAGWESLYYGEKVAINTLCITGNWYLPVEIHTEIFKVEKNNSNGG